MMGQTEHNPDDFTCGSFSRKNVFFADQISKRGAVPLPTPQPIGSQPFSTLVASASKPRAPPPYLLPSLTTVDPSPPPPLLPPPPTAL